MRAITQSNRSKVTFVFYPCEAGRMRFIIRGEMRTSKLSRAASLMSKKGTKARVAQMREMSPEQRSEMCRKAALARWKKPPIDNQADDQAEVAAAS